MIHLEDDLDADNCGYDKNVGRNIYCCTRSHGHSGSHSFNEEPMASLIKEMEVLEAECQAKFLAINAKHRPIIAAEWEKEKEMRGLKYGENQH